MKRILILIVAVCLLTGCASASGPDYAPGENRLTLWTSLEPEVYEPLVKEFEERTGIWVRVRQGNGAQLVKELPGSDCDVLLGIDIIVLAANGELFRPHALESADFVPGCPAGDSWLPLSANRAVFVYNPKMVRHNMPRQWNDLLAETWRGQVAFADPEEETFSLLVLNQIMTHNSDSNPKDTLIALAANVNSQTDSLGDVLTRVINGTDALAILPEDMVQRRIQKGASLVTEDSLELCLTVDGGAIPADAPHGENAQRFLEFLLSEDAQWYVQKHCFRGSVLASLNPGLGNAHFPRMEQAKEKRLQILELWNSVREVAP